MTISLWDAVDRANEFMGSGGVAQDKEGYERMLEGLPLDAKDVRDYLIGAQEQLLERAEQGDDRAALLRGTIFHGLITGVMIAEGEGKPPVRSGGIPLQQALEIINSRIGTDNLESFGNLRARRSDGGEFSRIFEDLLDWEEVRHFVFLIEGHFKEAVRSQVPPDDAFRSLLAESMATAALAATAQRD